MTKRLLPIALALAILCGCAAQSTTAPTEPAPDAQSLSALLEEAYIYAFPLLIMDRTAQASTNFAEPMPNGKAPINQLGHRQDFPDASYVLVPKPNVDTLYSTACLDLSEEPLVVSIPAIDADRYNLLQFMDAWTNVFASVGTRTTGNGAQTFLVAKEGWSGTAPEGMPVYTCTTSCAWLVGRLQIDSREELSSMGEVLSQYRLVPLSQWGGDYVPPKHTPDPALSMDPAAVQLATLPMADFFSDANRLMAENPPYDYDAPMLERLAAVGVGPGLTFDPASMEAAGVDLEAVRQAALAKISDVSLTTAPDSPNLVLSNGWSYNLGTGAFGTDYLRRAQVSLRGLGANINEDAIYPSVLKDADGQRLNGANRYILHYTADEIPQAGAFWSLTMYNDEDHFVDNELNRYALRDRDPLTYGPDGSLTFYIQKDRPADVLLPNWLPAPEGNFGLTLRIYVPDASAVAGTWRSPPVERLP